MKVQIRSGWLFNLSRPSPLEVRLADIAHALSNIARFNGHTRYHYSVAQHAVLVSRLAPAEHALAGLMHDAAEAYIGDLVRPLRAALPEFQRIEDRVAEVIASRYGYAWPPPPAVREADDRALALELEKLFERRPEREHIAGEYSIPRLTPDQARELFLRRAFELMPHLLDRPEWIR